MNGTRGVDALLICATNIVTNAGLGYIKNANTEDAIFCNTKTPWGLDNSGCGK
jgi:hypothetical protein